MGSARINTSSLYGARALAVSVEVRVWGGQEKFTIIGLGDGAVKESRDRVRSALIASGFTFPKRVLVNLSPAEIKKEGAGFDLAIALGILAASGQIKATQLFSTHVVGELSLEGAVRPVRGMVVHAVGAAKNGATQLLVPVESVQEATLIDEVEPIGVSTLIEAVAWLSHGVVPPSPVTCQNDRAQRKSQTGLQQVSGQKVAKRAMQIAAAGGHNVLFIGPPGCGKSMLAERFPTILPCLNKEELLEVVEVHSVAELSLEPLLAGVRPFRSPHHLISEVGLTGGGSYPRPGEISLAHRGVLFLDEFPEFRRSAIEALRAPLESKKILVNRSSMSVEFPANFQLIAAMNPCPCGRLGVRGLECLCSRTLIQSYLRKLSQPILDRIDLHIELEAVPLDTIVNRKGTDEGQTSEKLKEVVDRAQLMAMNRSGSLNANLCNEEISKHLRPTREALQLLTRISAKGLLSARGYFRVLKVSRSIADIEGTEQVHEEHLAEAIGYRGLARIEAYSQGETLSS